MQSINLLPWRETLREKIKYQWIRRLIMGLIITYAVLFSVEYYFVTLINRGMEQRMKLSYQIQALNPQVSKIYSLDKQIKRYEQSILTIHKIDLEKPIGFYGFLSQFPDSIFIKSMQYENKQLLLKGTTLLNQDITKATRILNKNPCLNHIEIKEIKKNIFDKNYEYSFVIKAIDQCKKSRD